MWGGWGFVCCVYVSEEGGGEESAGSEAPSLLSTTITSKSQTHPCDKEDKDFCLLL